MTQTAYYDEGSDAKRKELAPAMAEAVAKAHTELIEAAAEADTELMEKYFSTGELTSEEIRDGMRKAARDHMLNTVPVFVTSGGNNIGTVPLLEALTVYVSPPSDRR